MKEVAILLLVALMLNGCGSNSTPATTTTASGNWQAEMAGGSGPDSGFSFITTFTVGGDGSLSVSYFQFLNSNSGQCFPVSGGTQTGTMVLTSSGSVVSGTFSFVVQSGNNTLTLTGVVTGTANGTTLTATSITGTWALTGDAGCTGSSGTFTMTKS